MPPPRAPRAAPRPAFFASWKRLSRSRGERERSRYMRFAISRACRRSWLSSSWKPAKTTCSIQRIRPQGVSLSFGIVVLLPGLRSGNSGLVGSLRVGGREEGADPARLVALQVDEHRKALLLSAAEAVIDEDPATDDQCIVGQMLDRIRMGPGAEAIAEVAHPLAKTVVAD